jgi:putative sigma-54 modulation protein
MNKHIAGRHFELTEPIKNYIESALESLEKYNLEIISAHCVVSGDTKNGKKGFSVEFVVNLKDKNTVVITQRDKDVYAAIDLAVERLKKSLRCLTL